MITTHAAKAASYFAESGEWAMMVLIGRAAAYIPRTPKNPDDAAYAVIRQAQAGVNGMLKQDAARAASDDANRLDRSADAMNRRGEPIPAGPDMVKVNVISIRLISRRQEICDYPLCGQAYSFLRQHGLPNPTPSERIDTYEYNYP